MFSFSSFTFLSVYLFSMNGCSFCLVSICLIHAISQSEELIVCFLDKHLRSEMHNITGWWQIEEKIHIFCWKYTGNYLSESNVATITINRIRFLVCVIWIQWLLDVSDIIVVLGFQNFSFFCLLKEFYESIVILAIYEENYVFNLFSPLEKRKINTISHRNKQWWMWNQSTNWLFDQI